MKKRSVRLIITTLVVIIIATISNLIVRTTPISTFSIFDTTNLFTYFGVLIGFALTIYTFGLSMVSDIKEKIEKLDKLTLEEKKDLYQKLISGFTEIKHDIWFIFYSVVVIIGFAIAKDIPNPFGWKIDQFKLPETSNLTLFITTTIAMSDIMRSLFNLAEINLNLNKS